MPITKRFQITSPDCVNYGIYGGATAEDAFRAMEQEGGGDAGDIGAWIIREVVSRGAAKAQAHRESNMYGWITWDEKVGCKHARQILADWRRDRAAYLCGETA